jgi:hypothetical protein
MSRLTSATAQGKGIGIFLIPFSMVFFAAGLLVYLDVRDNPHTAGSAWTWLIMSALAVPVFLLGVFLMMRGLAESRVLRSGLRGHATVLGMTGTGMGVGYGGDSAGGDPIYRVQLRVTVAGMADYDASVRIVMTMTNMAQVRTGATIPVRVDQDKPTRVAVDWPALSGGSATNGPSLG